MKTLIIYTLIVTASVFIFSSCNDESETSELPVSPSTTFSQADQVGRPAINTVFVSSGNKDAFNTTIPGNMEAAFQQSFEDRLLALNGNYSTNALGQDATAFTTLLSNDVLNLATNGVTTFFDGENVLTGNNLTDDEIDVELLLIFGGPDGSSNPGLTSDNVDSNDLEFLNSFPYLAPAHQ